MVESTVGDLEINDDLKREFHFYNSTRDNVMKGMAILVQANLPIARPMDFLAEMVKTDKHMVYVKRRFLMQKQKIDKFEEKKSKEENKKFRWFCM